MSVTTWILYNSCNIFDEYSCFIYFQLLQRCIDTSSCDPLISALKKLDFFPDLAGTTAFLSSLTLRTPSSYSFHLRRTYFLRQHSSTAKLHVYQLNNLFLSCPLHLLHNYSYNIVNRLKQTSYPPFHPPQTLIPILHSLLPSLIWNIFHICACPCCAAKVWLASSFQWIGYFFYQIHHSVPLWGHHFF